MLEIKFVKDYTQKSNQAIIVLVNDQLKLDPHALRLDKECGGIIAKTVENPIKFNGKLGQQLSLSSINNNGDLIYLVLIGIGDETKIVTHSLENIGGNIYNTANILKAESILLDINTKIGEFEPEIAASHIASGSLLAAYKFDKHFTKQTEAEKFSTKELEIISSNPAKLSECFEKRRAVAMGVYFARDVMNEAPNKLYPESYAEAIVEKLEPLGVDVSVYGEREMKEWGMRALLGVGQGSDRESKIVIMEYNGGASDQKPVGLVGKGVTFDTGGISLKPPLNMHEMKHDMGGSAAVAGAIKALALRQAKINVVGIVGLVENMPSGNAQRPGDVVKTMSGQTVEVLNTDAEGRLVLADCLTYIQKHHDPDCIIDLATLTGAIVVSFADVYAGCFSNNTDLANNLLEASDKVNEKLWRMPMHKDFDEMLKSDIADVANIGGRGAGSSTAAQFLGRFIDEGRKWAHLDIAGVSWSKCGKNPIAPKGAVGFGVRLIDQFIADHYEGK